MNSSHPIVAIRTLVYNHEPYLRDYFNGILMQQTSFPFVVIVHDDASTDNSADIIREYAERYPDIIKPIFETENQYSKGNGTLFRIMTNACMIAKYMAYCEADDYWTDPNKLQRQVDFLENNPEYSAIGENATVENSVVNKKYLFNESPSHDVDMEEIITQRRFPTAGVVCRTKAINGLQKECNYYHDTMHWCWLLSKGKFRYSSIISSVYRKGTQGVTVSIPPFKFAQRVEKWNLEILRVFNVTKIFIFHNIAYNYYICSKNALRRMKFKDFIQCFYYTIFFLFKSSLL